MKILYFFKNPILLFVFLLGYHQNTLAQTPTHFKIGESTFANIDIYSIIQSKEGDLYVATSDGLYLYNYNQFVRIPNVENQKGNALFNLTDNVNGDIYCYNLKGQIFKIVDKRLQLYYEIPFKEQVNSPALFFDKDGSLLIFAKHFFKLDKDLKQEILIKNRTTADSISPIFVRPMQMIDGTIICTHAGKKDRIFIIYKNGKIETHNYNEIKWTNENDLNNGSLSAFKLDNKIIYVTEYNNFSDAFPVSMLTNARRKIYQISNDILLSLNNKKGMNFWNLKNDTLQQNPMLFPNTFISAQHYTTDGTLILGTFGEGIIIIPNIHSLKIEMTSSMRGIDVGANKTILSGIDGIIYEYQSKLKKIAERKLNLDEIFLLKNNYSFLKESNIISSYGSMDNIAIVKDVAEADSGFFFAANNGIFYASEDFRNGEIQQYKTSYVDQYIVALYGNQRYNSLTYIKLSKQLYFSNANKVEYLNNAGKTIEITHKGKSIYCTDLANYKKTLIIATSNQGILFYKNQVLSIVLDQEKGLSSNNVKKLKQVGDWLYILTEKKLQVLDLKRNKLISLSTENGVIDHLINNFSADENNLWLLKSKAFIKIPTNSINFEKQDLHFNIDSVLTRNKSIPFNSFFQLGFEEKKLSLFLRFNDLVKVRDSEFQVKLDEGEWISYPANQNEIEIQNFDYGNHSIAIRLKYRDDYYNPQSISFNLSAPFYLRWWFYPIVTLIIAWIIILFFRRKLRLQAKESRRINELNASKLRAIQSQMNPHFIFNALNSIQYLVISGDKDGAYSYITRFANLVRRTLEYSDKETISILQEIELLEVYLTLEKLRFSEDFEFHLAQKNMKDVQVPPMLIQPFIENALIHGLLHKEGFKKLNIFIEVFDEHIICKIEDNGIGRTEGKKIRLRQRGDHKSFALNAITNRLHILNEYSDQKLGYVYEDFLPSENDVTTRVTLTIPIKR